MEPLAAQQADQELYDLQEFEDYWRSILAAVEANVLEQRHQDPLRFEQLLASYHGFLQNSETVVAKFRFNYRSQKRQVAHCRTLIEQMRKAVKRKRKRKLRVHFESFDLELQDCQTKLGLFERQVVLVEQANERLRQDLRQLVSSDVGLSQEATLERTH